MSTRSRMKNKIRMSKDQATLQKAKDIVALHEFMYEPDPKCTQCKGTGEYEEESHHNGDYYQASCPCKNRNKPVVHLSESSVEALILAKHYLKDK